MDTTSPLSPFKSLEVKTDDPSHTENLKESLLLIQETSCRSGVDTKQSGIA